MKANQNIIKFNHTCYTSEIYANKYSLRHDLNLVKFHRA